MAIKTFAKKITPFVILILVTAIAYFATLPRPGELMDELNGVGIYYNGRMHNDFGRNITEDGYNLGIKYQCVEFVKRYYYEFYNHKMPDTYGHAKDFFIPRLADGAFNAQRGLIQYTNPSQTKPQVGDIIVMKGKYGHVGIVSYVTDDALEMAQQNTRQSRRIIHISQKDGMWKIDNSRVFGWLRQAQAPLDLHRDTQ